MRRWWYDVALPKVAGYLKLIDGNKVQFNGEWLARRHVMFVSHALQTHCYSASAAVHLRWARLQLNHRP